LSYYLVLNCPYVDEFCVFSDELGVDEAAMTHQKKSEAMKGASLAG